MAVTKLWAVKTNLGKVIDYANNPNKTRNPKYTEEQYQALADVLTYAKDEEKTEKQFFVDGMYKADDGKAFVLEFYSIPREACIELVTQNWNANLGLIAMKVKGSADGYSIQTGAFAGNCNTQYKQGVGLFCAADFPISPEQAVTVCDYVKNNNISWKFY